MDAAAPLLSLGTLTIDLTGREVCCGDRVVGLTEMESRLLGYLWARSGEAVSRDELLVEVWGYAPSVASRAPHHTVTRLRRKLSMDPEAAARLSTVRGLGYRLEGAVPLVQPGERPARPTPLFGRAVLIGQVLDALAPGSLVTLTGPGGIGKTRIAEQVAERAEGGVCWVSLVDARSAAQVTHRIASALGVSDAQLAEKLARLSTSLLILDNAEQGAAALAALLGRWAAQAPALRVLVTSRFRLGLAAERRIIVPPLPAADAARLFEDRAARLWPALALTPAHRGVLGQLEGVPLSIELAAGHAPLLPGLAAGNAPLRSRHRDTPDRHASMQAVLQWSWALLSAAQQRALAELSLFAGGFSPAAASAVLSEPVRVLDLEERSLVQAGPDRMWLLEHVRAFAAARLEAPDRAAAARRHAEHYAAMGEPDWLDTLWTEAGAQRQARLRAEQANLSAALDRALAQGWWTLGAQLWLAAHGLLRRGHLHLDGDRLQRLLDGEQPDTLRARLLAAHGDYLRLSGRPAEAIPPLRAAAALLAEQPHEAAAVQCSLGGCLLQSGQQDEARRLLERALATARQGGDLLREARVLTNLGTCCPEAREQHYAEALQRARTVGDQRLARRLLIALAGMYRQRACWELAEAYLREALAGADDQQDQATRLAALQSLGNLHNEAGQHDAAVTAYQEALALAAALDRPVPQVVVLGNLGLLHERRGEKAAALRRYEEAVRRSAALSSAEVTGVARSRLGALLCRLGAQARGQALLDEATDILSTTSEHAQRSAHHCRAAEHARDDADARRHLAEAWRLAEAAAAAQEGPLRAELLRVEALLRSDAAGDREH